jgi:hypothetical protein
MNEQNLPLIPLASSPTARSPSDNDDDDEEDRVWTLNTHSQG